MRMRVLVTGYRSSEEIHPTSSFTVFGCWIHQRTTLGAKRFPHQLNADVAISKSGRLADRYFHGFHRLEGGDVKFFSQEGMPYRFSDSGVQNFARKEAGDLEVEKIRIRFDLAPSFAQLQSLRLLARRHCQALNC